MLRCKTALIEPFLAGGKERRRPAMSINDFRISIRIWAIVGLAALGLAISTMMAASVLRGTMMEDRRDKIASVVATARGIMAYWGQQSASGALPEAEAKRLAVLSLRQMRYGDGEYIFVYDNAGVAVLLPSKPELEGKSMLETKDASGVHMVRQLIATAQAGKGEFIEYSWMKAGASKPELKLSQAVSYAPWNWVVGSGLYLGDVDTAVHAAVGELLGGAAAVLLVIFALATAIVRGIVRPLGRLTERMQRLAQHDLTIIVEGADHKDELGAMARAMQVFKDNAIAKDALELERKRDEAHAIELRHTQMLELAERFEQAVGEIVKEVSTAAGELDGTAASMSETAEEATRQSSAVASGATEASANVQTVAAATEELTASIREISNLVNRSSTIATEAVSEVERSNSMVQDLARAAERIGEVIVLINDIASQTNLLALNATIEAARAGEMGKGFAVVAGEVKALATQTAKATEEISQQITSIQAETRNTVQAIRSVGVTISGISEISVTIAGAIEEQSAAASEISSNIQQAAQGTDQVSHNISGVKEASADTGASAVLVQGAAHNLAGQAKLLREHIDGFLHGLRTGT
jgi:methyl-accepting chemotaxis protein